MKLRLRVLVDIDQDSLIETPKAFVEGLVSDLKNDTEAMDHITAVTVLVSEMETTDD